MNPDKMITENIMCSQYTVEPTYRKIPQRNNLFEGHIFSWNPRVLQENVCRSCLSQITTKGINLQYSIFLVTKLWIIIINRPVIFSVDVGYAFHYCIFFSPLSNATEREKEWPYKFLNTLAAGLALEVWWYSTDAKTHRS